MGLPTTNDAFIFGASGHARVVADAMEKQGVYRAIAFVVDEQYVKPGAECYGLPIVGAESWLGHASPMYFIVAIGDNYQRKAKTQWLESLGHTPAVVVHPFSSVGRGTELGPGSLVCAKSMIDPDVKTGPGMILNACTGIGHDTVIGEFVHLAAGSGVGANCHIGNRVFLAGRASVVSDVKIGDDTILAPGALTIKDIPANVMAVGVPARIRSKPSSS